MRLRALLVACGVAGGLLATAAPASASCDPVWSAVLDRCANECTVVGPTYNVAQDHVSKLPDLECAA